MQLASYENLVWAWLKLVRYYRRSEVWYDEIELSRFELQLDNELASLSAELQSGKYVTSPVRPIPYPKRNADGEMEVRQFFWVNFRDQLAWLAYLNLIGAEIDSQMPTWSYGNRLYRSLIIEQPSSNDIPRFTTGPYRNTKGQVYRPFKQSWPLYRRHVLVALKKLTRPGQTVSFDERENDLLEAEPLLEANERLIYLTNQFWNRHSKTVYWCSFDIEKFYPSITLDRVREALLARSDTVRSIGNPLLESLTHFEIDYSGWTRSDLKRLGMTGEKTVSAIPTGLISAGFLANAAMLSVDDWVATQVRRRQIAHFRYVDDHIIVAPNFDSLTEWFLDYQRNLQERLNCRVNQDKTEPKEFRLYTAKRRRKQKRSAMRDTWLDPAFPSPLMTKTLEKVSDLARANFDLLDRDEQHRILNDLEHLLLARLPEEELPEKTRVTFAATLLGRFTAQAEHTNSDLLAAVLEYHVAKRELSALERHLRSLRKSTSQFKELRSSLALHQERVRLLYGKIISLRKSSERKRERAHRATTAVLLKALELHPEKLRMWERVLEFCRRSGGSATTITNSLRSHRRKRPLAYTYLVARTLQVLAKQSVICLNDYFNPALSLDRRIYAGNFLSSVPLALRRIRGNPRYEYVGRSYELINLVLSFANFAVRAESRIADLPTKTGIRLRSVLKDSPRFRFDGFDSAAVWWLARNLSVWSYPRIMLRSLEAGLRVLPPRDSTSWKIWRYLDSEIPDEAYRQIAVSREISASVEGWLAETLHRKGNSLVGRLKRVRGPVGRVARALRARQRNRMQLPDWIAWTAASERDPFDPRLTEWTALEITIQISDCVRSYSAESRKEMVSSVFNFLVPQEWTNDPTTCVTWEAWRKQVARSHITARKRLRIRDGRIMPSIDDFPELNIEFGSVRAIAVVLLGLLRRDFRLPNHLLPIGYHGLFSRSAVAHIQSKPCSSRTMAILESCLMDRSAETLLIKEHANEKYQRLDQDIETDIPIIQSINELINELRKAQAILADYQLTVSAHQPRQLIPIYLEQYTKDNWRPDVDDPEEQGDEDE